VCQGFSEPDAGSDLASLRTRAQLDGDDWHVSGQKVWISLGHIADWCLLLVRTDTIESRHRGLTMLWLDMRLPGVTVHPIDFADGRDELAEIFLDDVVVPAHCVVGDVGGGWDVAMFLLQFERGNYAWQRYAWMRAQLAHALRASRVSTRTDAVGGAFLDLVALAARARRTLLLLADGERLGPRTSIDKLLMSTAEQTIFDAARTITWPATELAERSEDSFEAEWFYSRAASVYGGAAEVQHDIIAEQVLGLPRR
jgi:alkylation response protein AidB-like acyl-CoA dehydrogenase